jgi:hypothetical protein
MDRRVWEPEIEYYGINPKCPQRTRAKGLVPRAAWVTDGGTFKKWGLGEGKEVTGGMPLKEIVLSQTPLFLSLCFSATMK